MTSNAAIQATHHSDTNEPMADLRHIRKNVLRDVEPSRNTIADSRAVPPFASARRTPATSRQDLAGVGVPHLVDDRRDIGMLWYPT